MIRLTLIVIVVISLFGGIQAQNTIFTDPGQSYNNTDATTSDTYGPVNVSGCSSITFSIDYESSDDWAGSGNMESVSECGACSGDPLNQSSDCVTCWDFFFVEFLLDGVVVGSELVGAGFNVQTASFSFPVCTDGATTASMNVYTQTWASAETISFSNIEINCSEAGEIITTASGCSDPLYLEIDYPDLGVVNSTTWSSDGSAVINPVNSPATNAIGASNGETFTVTTEDNNGCFYDDEITVTGGSGASAGTGGSVLLCSTSSAIDLFDELTGSPDAGGVWEGPSVLSNGDQGTFLPGSSGDGMYHYIQVGSGGCPNDTAFVDVMTETPPEAGVGSTISICNSTPSFDLQDSIAGAFDLGGFWEGASALTGGELGTFDPAINVAGDYEYIVSSTGSCENDTAFFSVIINTVASAGIDATISVCENGSTINLFNELGGSPSAGGTWLPVTAIGNGVYDPLVDAAGVYEYVVTSGGSCPNDTAEVSVSLETSLEAGTGLTIMVCNSTPAFNLQDSILGTFDAGGSWNGPSVLTGGELGTFDPGTSTGGDYEYIVTSSGVCNNDTAFITVVVTTVVSAGLDGVVDLCEDDASIDLFNELGGSPNIGGTWLPSTVAGGGVFDPTVDAGGVYEYIVASSGTCPNDTAEVVVTVNAIPQVQVASTDPSCFGFSDGAIDLTISTSSNTVTWTMPGGGSQVQEDISGLVDETYTYSVVSTAGCETTGSVTITEPAAIDLQVQITDETCPGACDGMVVASTASGVSPFTYTFAGASNGTNQAQNLCGGNINVSVVDANGCIESTNANIDFISAAVEPTISGPLISCESETNVAYTTDVVGGQWNINGVDVSSGNFNPSAVGLGTYEIIYTTPGVCGGDDTLEVSVAEEPEIAIDFSELSGCAPFSVEMINTQLGLNDNDCLWTLSNGMSSTSCGNANFVLSNQGCYDVTLQVTNDYGCSTTLTSPTQVCVDSEPSAEFELNDISFDDLDGNLQGDPLETGLLSYSWLFESQEVSDQEQLVYDLSGSTAGEYLLCLAVENMAGCRDTTCQEISYQDALGIYVPNTFTPNADLMNDVFSPVLYSTDFFEYEFIIANRWGTVFFKSNDVVNSNWDGTLYGQPAPEDVYVWKMTYKLNDSAEVYELRGHVTLVR